MIDEAPYVPVVPQADEAAGPVPAPAPPAETPALEAAPWGAFAGLDFHWTTWIFLVWLAGVAVVLIRLAIAHAGVHLLVSRATMVHDDDWHLMVEDIAQRLGIGRLVRLRRSAWTAVPLSVGVWRPTIVLPEKAETWDATHRRTVLLHELAHVKRRDCLMQFLTQITCALHWFNPMVWVAARQLYIERERACDDVVLVAGMRASTYAETLLETARSLNAAEWSTAAALAMARRSQLEGRLLAILDPTLRHRGLSRAGGILAVVLVASIVLPLAALHPAQAQQVRPDTVTASEQTASDTLLVLFRKPIIVSGDIDIDPDLDIDIDLYLDLDVDIDTDIDIDTDFSISADIHIDPNLNFNLNLNVNPDFDIDLEFDYDPDLTGAVGDTITVEQLIKLRRYDIDAEFIRGLKALGFTDLTFEELIMLGKYGADPEYIQEMQDAGYANHSAREYAGMSKYGVDPEFVQAMNQAGLSDLSAEELISLSKYGADDDLIASLNQHGYTGLSVDDLVSASKYGVDEDLIASLSQNGYTGLSMDDLVSMSRYGLDGDFIEEMKSAGLDNLTLDQLIQLSRYDVDADYVKEIREAGIKDLTVDKLIEMRRHGVDADFIRSMRENDNNR